MSLLTNFSLPFNQPTNSPVRIRVPSEFDRKHC